MKANRSCPNSTVIPVLGYPDVEEAVRWLCRAFGFTVRVRIGNHRAQLVCGDGDLIVRELPQGAVIGQSDEVMIRVEDADGHCARATASGSVILDPPADRPYGERQYGARDFAGRNWKVTQSIRDVAPED